MICKTGLCLYYKGQKKYQKKKNPDCSTQQEKKKEKRKIHFHSQQVILLSRTQKRVKWSVTSILARKIQYKLQKILK